MERLIHADSSRIEVGMITDFISFDAQIHNNCEIADNTFSLEMSISAWKAEQIMRGDYIYIDGSEFGGLVGSVNKNTGADTVTIKGILWRALLAMRIISPPSGQAYRAFTNTELNSIVADIVENDYVNLFHVSEENTGVSISCQFRYQTKLSGLSKALLQAGYTLSCVYNAAEQRVITSARRCADYSEYADISPDLGIGMSITAGRVDDYNHCIALGTGELAERMVREIWMLDGKIYKTRPAALTESALRSMTFDYPNAESEDELLSSAGDALLQYAAMSSAEIDLSQLRLDLQLDDKILTVDRDLGISAIKSVSQRVITINQNGTTIRTEVE
jgi:hypothetical protein